MHKKIFGPKDEQLINLIAWELNLSPAQLNINTDFVDDLHLDPVDRDLLIAKLENRLGVYLSQEEASGIATVRDARRVFMA
jgi:acyl carrier protein